MSSESILVFFAKYIESELGIIYSETNYYQLQNRLEQIIKLVGADDIQNLYQKAQNGITGMFRQMLLDIATNNETSFFRDIKVYQALEQQILPSLCEVHPKGEPLHIWSAASSTGQEPLSICMTLNEWNIKNKWSISCKIIASDISERALSRARSATYSQLEVQRGLPVSTLVKYFSKGKDDTWTASPELTKNIEYRSLNLKHPFPFVQQFDLIFCRNVLIYQSVESKIEILNRITKVLRPDGILVLGAGESLLGLSSDYCHLSADGVVVYKKKKNIEIAAA